ARTAEDPIAQLVCAETAVTLDEIRLAVHHNLGALLAYAERGEKAPVPERLRYKFQSSFAVQRCGLLAARLFEAAGAAGIYDKEPFGRVLADIQTARQHISNRFHSYGRAYGAALLGGEINDFMV